MSFSEPQGKPFSALRGENSNFGDSSPWIAHAD
jgi:hypothetical protein